MLTQLDEAADGDAENGDLFFEASGGACFKIGEIGFVELFGIETVDEVVLVAGLATAVAPGGRGLDRTDEIFDEAPPYERLAVC